MKNVLVLLLIFAASTVYGQAGPPTINSYINKMPNNSKDNASVHKGDVITFKIGKMNNKVLQTRGYTARCYRVSIGNSKEQIQELVYEKTRYFRSSQKSDSLVVNIDDLLKEKDFDKVEIVLDEIVTKRPVKAVDMHSSLRTFSFYKKD